MDQGTALDRRASSGFLNLLTPLSASSLPTLFHAGSAHGVLALQSLPPLVQPDTVPDAVTLIPLE